VANSQERSAFQHPDLLAAVVLHTLVTEGRNGITPARMAVACERDPDTPADMAEIEAALKLLLEDGLAKREGQDDGCGEGKLHGGGQSEGDLFRPTRAAIRAAELSF
jgi:hypothetical protein